MLLGRSRLRRRPNRPRGTYPRRTPASSSAAWVDHRKIKVCAKMCDGSRAFPSAGQAVASPLRRPRTSLQSPARSRTGETRRRRASDRPVSGRHAQGGHEKEDAPARHARRADQRLGERSGRARFGGARGREPRARPVHEHRRAARREPVRERPGHADRHDERRCSRRRPSGRRRTSRAARGGNVPPRRRRRAPPCGLRPSQGGAPRPLRLSRGHDRLPRRRRGGADPRSAWASRRVRGSRPQSRDRAREPRHKRRPVRPSNDRRRCAGARPGGGARPHAARDVVVPLAAPTDTERTPTGSR